MASRQPPRAKKATPASKNVAKKAGAKKAFASKASASKASASKAGTNKASPNKASANKGSANKASTDKAGGKKLSARRKVATPPSATKKAEGKSRSKTGATSKAKPAASSSPKATPARDALSALAQKRAIKATLGPSADGKEVVEAYLRDVDHPFKAEMEAVRQIILGASPKISERIKWNAPSFYYKEDLGAFNPRATEYAHLILLFPGGAGMQPDDGLLEGKHKDRREVKFHSLSDVASKKPALEKLIKRWVALRDR